MTKTKEHENNVKNNQEQVTLSLSIEDNEHAMQIFGTNGENLKYLRENIPLNIKSRGNEILLEGTEDQVKLGQKCVLYLQERLESGANIEKSDVVDCFKAFSKNMKGSADLVFQKQISITRNKSIYTRTIGQKKYVDAMENKDIVFGIGPAGTGKTYLAMAMAMSRLMHGEVDRLILTRPAVEAGEKLGFLPGDLVDKVDPYLRPLYDAINDMVDYEKAQRLIASGQIEIAPLAFMRGRTLSNSYVILDEAQNCTEMQMKMFLTRLGKNSKAAITGDVTQTDLGNGTRSGLVQAAKVLKDVEGIHFHYFKEVDVVRHSLVAKIINAYEKDKKLP